MQVLDDVEVVGSFRKDTMLRGSRTADIVVVMKNMPTSEYGSRKGTVGDDRGLGSDKAIVDANYFIQRKQSPMIALQSNR